MSKIISAGAIDGAILWVARAEKALDESIRAKGEDCPVAFPIRHTICQFCIPSLAKKPRR